MSEEPKDSRDDERWHLPDHVVLRKVGDEMVLLNFETESYFGLDDVGVDFIEALLELGSFELVATRLLQMYDAAPDEIRSDLQRLVGELSGAGLLEQG
jgi:hypothetical protein